MELRERHDTSCRRGDGDHRESTRSRAQLREASYEPRRSRAEERGGGGGGRGYALFLMGLPGAGKTTIKRRRIRRGMMDIEPDRFKCRHPKFSLDMGEETDEEVHRWSVRRAADAFDDVIADPRKPDFVFDSSGSNARWLGRRIAAARDAGYTTELLWVDVPVEVALLRNRNRAVEQGGQWCPERIIMDKADVMEASFEELRREADSMERLQNWSDRDRELEDAKWDLYLYPGPRPRPPSLRPGEEGYGEAPPGARSPSPTPGSMRTIRIGPWRRSDEVMKKKDARLQWMDSTFRGNRERYVLEHVLKGRDVLLEPNKFPYFMPPGLDHWTIWARRDFGHNELCEYIEGWLKAREPHNVVAWQYDDNRGRRTIDIWHVHLYFKGANGQRPVFGLREGKSHPVKRAISKETFEPSVRLAPSHSPCSV